MNEVTVDLIARWRAGEQLAAQQLFQRYAEQLIALARGRLSDRFNRRFDPEDVVQSAYRSFFSGVHDGRYSVERGGDLWRLLVVITLHKLQHQVRRNLSDKRSLDRERDLGQGKIPEDMLARVPSPVEAVALAEELERVMGLLEPLQRRMLELRLQGYNLSEIGTATQRCPRTVCRTLELVKQLLEQQQAQMSRS